MPPPAGDAGCAMLVDQAYTNAIALLQNGRVADAEAIFRDLLKIQPEHPELLHFLGLCRHRLGDRLSAEPLIKAAIRRNPQNAIFHFNLGILLQELNRLDEALTCYDTAIALKPDFLDAFNSRGNVFF